MNIKDAKQEISNTLRAYHRKDENGRYAYPLIRQRPILLMGPPGIGKTAIMEQVAKECEVGLVSYTITHHTRQSAIGLPHIETRIYHGKEMSITEYTLSEIIASVYDTMEQTGKNEGILFIDEINCVSETLAPTMLQFLQNKTFGSHRVPEGWMIVAAGNSPEYNKSVREFDIVTLDRVRKIDIDVDCDVWMEYAWKHEIHGAILSYLNIKKENFYSVENTVDGKFFVTARGWEDLSLLLLNYEDLQIPVTKDLIIQFLQKEEVAVDFAAYYQLYEKYGQDYQIPEILQGTAQEQEYERKVEMAQNASFEERFTVVGITLDYLKNVFCFYDRQERQITTLHQALAQLKNYLKNQNSMESFDEFIHSRQSSLEVKINAELASERDIRTEEWVITKLQEYSLGVKKEHLTAVEEGFSRIKELFFMELNNRKNLIKSTSQKLENSFQWIADCFKDAQEMILFVSGLSKNEKAMSFIAAHGCDAYFQYSEKLLYHKREEELQNACRELLERDNLNEKHT